MKENRIKKNGIIAKKIVSFLLLGNVMMLGSNTYAIESDEQTISIPQAGSARKYNFHFLDDDFNYLKDIVDEEGNTVLHEICRKGDLTGLKGAFAPLSGDQRKELLQLGNDYGESPLHVAAMSNARDVMEELVSVGADVNARDNMGRTPLHAAALELRSRSVYFLLTHDADAKLVDNEGQTALHLVASAFDIDMRNEIQFPSRPSERIDTIIARMLLDIGHIDPNSQNGVGETPLYIAAKNLNCGMSTLLLEKGADPDIANVVGNTPLLAAVSCMRTIYAYDEGKRLSTDTVESLLEYGANPNIQNFTGNTPLCVACQFCYDTANWLLYHGANPNIADKTGETPLHFAAIYGDADIVDKLLLRGSEVNVPTKEEKYTPLYYATKYRRRAVVEQLLENGADPTIADWKGDTPIEIARKRNYGSILARFNKYCDPSYSDTEYLELAR